MGSKFATLRKTQILMSCHFCNKKGVRWKCVECDVFMCTPCKEKIHLNLNTAENHEIVSFFDNMNDNPPKILFASEVICSVLNSYQTTVPIINSLLSSGDDLIYFINHRKEENAQLVKGKMLKSSIDIFQTLKKQIFDIAVNQEGEILYDELGKENVYVSTLIGEIKTVFDTSRIIPTALHINKDNELIVGCREHGPAFPVNEFSARQVIIFDNNNKRKMILEADKTGGKLFSYPARIKTDSKNVLYLVDWTDNDKRGRIVAVDLHGRLKFTYNGHPDLQAFYPLGIAITPSDNVILSDNTNNALHVLNTRGELLGLQFVGQEHHIERPCSLCMNSKGNLLIGNGLLDSDSKIFVTKLAERFL